MTYRLGNTRTGNWTGPGGDLYKARERSIGPSRPVDFVRNIYNPLGEQGVSIYPIIEKPSS